MTLPPRAESLPQNFLLLHWPRFVLLLIECSLIRVCLPDQALRYWHAHQQAFDVLLQLTAITVMAQ